MNLRIPSFRHTKTNALLAGSALMAAIFITSCKPSDEMGLSPQPSAQELTPDEARAAAAILPLLAAGGRLGRHMDATAVADSRVN
jgi:hypothetical protein